MSIESRVVDRLLALRVAQRFAARVMKPEKLQALMMKLRKGAGTSLKFKELIPVFDHLGGWLIEDTLLLVAESRGYSPTPVPDIRTYSHSHPGNVKTTWEEAKANEVSKLPDPERAKRHQKYYMDVSDIEESGSGQTSFTYKAWQAQLGTKMKAPNGKSVNVAENVDRFLENYPSTVFDFETRQRLSDWLQKETPFLDQINEKLGTEPLELEKQKRIDKRREELKEIARTKENIGECPVCDGMFRLLPKTREGKDKSMPGMVLHGYKRPGTGYIHSNCFGEFWPPFELSPEGAVHYLERYVKPSLPKAEARLKVLEKGEIETFYGPSGKEYKKSEMDPKDWDKKYAQEIKDQKDHIDDIEREIKRFEKKITGWEPKPLNLVF